VADPNLAVRDAPASGDGGPDPLIGAVINGKFRIVRAIARGGMGRIYYATQVPFDRPVALKVVQADTVNEEESQFLKRFLQEASILAKLQHPNVVMLFDYGRIEPSAVERYFIAMEYLDGETLATRFRTRGTLNTVELLVFARQILRGLRDAHARGIVHRDLKPSNIILVKESDGGEIVKLVDFGIGKVIQRNAVAEDLTQEGVMVGTPRYMAPEQFDGAVSPASDIYALGTIMYQALTGNLPFRGTTLAEFMVAKFAHAIPRLREVNPQCDAPESLEHLIFGMLARAPHERPTLDMLSMQLAAVEEEVFGTPHSLRRHITGSGPVLGPGSFRNTGQNPAITGQNPSLGPTPRSGIAPAQDSLRVPPTIVHSIGGLTPRPMATSTRPPSTSSRNTVVALLVGIGLLGGLGGVLGLWAYKKQPGKSPATTTTTVASGDPAPPTSVTPKTDDVPFTVLIESTPSGAIVTEDDKELGPTPLAVSIDKTSVAAGPRTFVLKKDGFLPTPMTQGPLTANAKSTVTLAPDPSAKKKDPKPQPHVVVAPPPTNTGAKPQNTGGLDIRLNR
jgi:serine/threonine-protein kinase